MKYYGPDGRTLSIEEWSQLMERRDEDSSRESWWRRQTVISDGVSVSTVWLGLDHELCESGPPLIWETMIFGGEHSQNQWRYPSRQAALDDHERIVAALRAGEAP